jgi:hypothetical protein
MTLHEITAAILVFLVHRNSVLISSSSSSEDRSAYKMAWFHFDWCKFCMHLTSLKIPPSQLKCSIKENNESNKTCRYVHGISLYQTFQKCNCSWFVSIEQNVNFKFQPPAIFVFLVSRKSDFIKSYSSSEDRSAYKTSWSRLEWWKFASTSEVWTSTILEYLKIQD